MTPEQLRAVMQQIGDIFFHQGVMPQALEYYFKADHLYSELGNPADISDNLNRIGKAYFKTQGTVWPLLSCRKAAILSAKVRHHLGIAEADKYIAQIFERKGRSDSAHKYLELAMQSYRRLHDNTQVAFTYA